VNGTMKRDQQVVRRRASLSIVAILSAFTMIVGGSAGIAGASTSKAHASEASNSTITIGTLSPPGTLDPTTSDLATDVPYLDVIYDTLTQLNPKTGALEPMLATSWKWSANRLQLDVTLRQGVEFQDGTPFNAQAVVKYSQAFIKAGDTADCLQYVTSVTAVGNYQVIYQLSQPNAVLPNSLAMWCGMIPSPTAVASEGSTFATHPVGAGPYKFVSEVPGSTYNFTAFSGYWNNAKVPRVKNLEFKVFQSDTSLVTAIESGDVNVAGQLSAQDVKALKAQRDLRVAAGPGPQIAYFNFNSSRVPLNNPKVRLAFNLALNRGAIAQAVTGGVTGPATQIMPVGVVGYDKALNPVYRYDPSKARRLLREAGYKNGVNLTCYYRIGLGFEIANPIIIAQEKAVGINLSLVPATAATIGSYLQNKGQPECLGANWGGDPIPAVDYQILWSKSFYNPGRTDYGIDPYFNELYSTYTTSGIQKLSDDIVKSQQTNPGCAPLWYAPLVDVYQSDIAGWVKSPLGKANWRGMYYKGS